MISVGTQAPEITGNGVEFYAPPAPVPKPVVMTPVAPPVPVPPPVVPPPPPGATQPIIPTDQPVPAPGTGTSSQSGMQVPDTGTGVPFDQQTGAATATTESGFDNPWLLAAIGGALVVALMQRKSS